MADDVPPPDAPGADSEAKPGNGSRWIGELDQHDFDVAFYERILLQQPSDIRLLRLLAELYARHNQHDRALHVAQRLSELLPDDPAARYNLACNLARLGSPERALEQLAAALRLGYNDFGHIEVDPDLESVRRLPQYPQLMRQHGAQA